MLISNKKKKKKNKKQKECYAYFFTVHYAYNRHNIVPKYGLKEWKVLLCSSVERNGIEFMLNIFTYENIFFW